MSMKHVVPFTLPANTEEAVVQLKSMGRIIATVALSAKGREMVSVDFGDLPSGVYSCQLLVNQSEISQRHLMVH